MQATSEEHQLVVELLNMGNAESQPRFPQRRYHLLGRAVQNRNGRATSRGYVHRVQRVEPHRPSQETRTDEVTLVNPGMDGFGGRIPLALAHGPPSRWLD